jgi:hypothetical protein
MKDNKNKSKGISIWTMLLVLGLVASVIAYVIVYMK